MPTSAGRCRSGAPRRRALRPAPRQRDGHRRRSGADRLDARRGAGDRRMDLAQHLADRRRARALPDDRAGPRPPDAGRPPRRCWPTFLRGVGPATAHGRGSRAGSPRTGSSDGTTSARRAPADLDGVTSRTGTTPAGVAATLGVMLEWLVVADDRTGALEVAGEMAARARAGDGDRSAATLDADAAGRGRRPREPAPRAAARGARGPRRRPRSPARHRAHKIDSMLRGNWADRAGGRPAGHRRAGAAWCRRCRASAGRASVASCTSTARRCSSTTRATARSIARPAELLVAAGATRRRSSSPDADALRGWLADADGEPFAVCDASSDDDLAAIAARLAAHGRRGASPARRRASPRRSRPRTGRTRRHRRPPPCEPAREPAIASADGRRWSSSAACTRRRGAARRAAAARARRRRGRWPPRTAERRGRRAGRRPGCRRLAGDARTAPRRRDRSPRW